MERAYTEEAYEEFRNTLVDRASQLEKLGWTGCTAEAVGRTLWCAAMLDIGKGKKVSKNWNFELEPLEAVGAARESASAAESESDQPGSTRKGSAAKKKDKKKRGSKNSTTGEETGGLSAITGAGGVKRRKTIVG